MAAGLLLACGTENTGQGSQAGFTGTAGFGGFAADGSGYVAGSGTFTAPLAGGGGSSGAAGSAPVSGNGGSVTGGTGAGGEVATGTGGGVVAGMGGSGGAVAGAGGSGGVAAGTGGSAAGSGGAGGTSDPGIPPCITSPNEVVMIGDSYMIWASHTFQMDMIALAGETWPFYAVAGASMASGGVQPVFIPGQFELAVAANPDIKLVVMDGGGNDILIPAATWIGGADCKNNQNAADVQVCRDIVDLAVSEATKGMDRMVEVGVKDVVYFFYPHVPEGTVLGGLYPNAMLDYALPLARDLCEGAEARTGGKLRCYFVDTVPVFEKCLQDHPLDGCFAATDIHENSNGSKAIAQAVWDRMQAECLGQRESSGCCAP